MEHRNPYKYQKKNLKRGDRMEPRVDDYMDSTCVASTGGGDIAMY
ncbi:MAG: hypothetical protein PVF58_01700 [Candidatus Methanofastidiosia archaeon]